MRSSGFLFCTKNRRKAISLCGGVFYEIEPVKPGRARMKGGPKIYRLRYVTISPVIWSTGSCFCTAPISNATAGMP